MSAATVFFTDIVGFSKKPTAEQRRLVDALTTEVTHQLRVLLNPPLDTPAVLALPTGDGVALAFMHRTNRLWDRSTVLQLTLRLHEWARDESASGNPVSLRVGIHVGPVELVTDINGKANVCGDTINFAQRVMDAASPRQTLFSEAAFREYVGVESSVITTPPFSTEMKAEFQGPVEVYAKHGLQILVHKLCLCPQQPWWENDDPFAKSLAVVSLTRLPKEVVGNFSERLMRATDVALVQIAGDRLYAKLTDGTVNLRRELHRLLVFMPDPDSYAHLELQGLLVKPDFLAEYVTKWRTYLVDFSDKHPRADVKLGLFREPPFIGASYLDWNRPGGKIHVSGYVWGLSAQMSPGYDIEWLGKNPGVVYESYSRGLEYLDSHTENALRQRQP